jgi:hypothetical protein
METVVHPPQPATPPQKEPFEQRLAKLELLKGKIPGELYDAKMQELLSEI